ncbi:MAG TPA: cytochrome b N-terminal domain-containing protein, partial [Pirellulales bacterium]
MKSLIAWFENRTGAGALAHAALYEHIPGGARWRYVWGSTLVFAFAVQVITGVFLWLSYSPSSQTAWESVYYIQHEMTGGWLLRGLHHFMAQAMVVLLVIHLAQVVIDGAYRAPREVNFWLGLVLMQIVLGLSLTGYLLPWDQKGYWATSVATNLMGIVPVVGAELQQVVVGGPEYGHHTLTRFFAMHAGVLPGLLVAFLVLHVALFRRHGLHARKPLKGPDATFWPDQILKDSVACLAVLAAVLVLVFWSGVRSEQGLMATLASEHPGDHLGAELGAPADGSSPYAAARPEWYFLFLFQFLKFFSGSTEVIGAIVIPGLLMGFLFLMPLIGLSKFGHRLNIAALLLLFVGIAALTAQAWWADRRASLSFVHEPSVEDTAAHAGWQASVDYLKAAEEAEEASLRARELARGLGIPPTGAITLLRNDPKTAGAILFADKCASCHNYQDQPGHGIVTKEPSAPNLYGFASREWIAGLLDPDKIATPQYFGLTEHKAGDMVSFVQGDEF